MSSTQATVDVFEGGPNLSNLAVDHPPLDLQRLLEAGTSLTGSEAKTLVALLKLRTASLKQLAEATGIRHSNIHAPVDSLAARGLCSRLVGRYSVWECPPPAEVLARLRAAEDERLQAERNGVGRTLDQAEALLAHLESDTEEPPITLADAARTGVVYLEAMASVTDTEVLVLNRGPYSGGLSAHPTVLEAMTRGVKARALYVAGELAAPDGELRRSADAFAAAGVEIRVVDSLPVSMAVIGESTALLAVPGRDASAAVPLHAAILRGENLVTLVSAAFQHLWEHAHPYRPGKSP